MARKGKAGLDYFSHDVTMRTDPKLRFVKAKHGFVAYGIYNALLEEIYQNGYYLLVDDKFNILFADENKLELNVYIGVLNDCIEEGLFNKEVYSEYGVLTSRRIQSNYIAGAERRNVIEFIKEYLLIEPEKEINDKYKENVIILSLNVNILEENVYIGTQRKGKEIESKEKGKEKESIDYNFLKEKYNEICISYSKLREITEKRKEKIRVRLEKRTIEEFVEAFQLIEKSDFCKGKNDRKWVVSFDWLIENDTNIVKVLEGKYNNGGQGNGKHSSDSGESNEGTGAKKNKWANDKTFF